MPRIASASPRITLQSVADAASVSRMTVSRALRNHPEIAPETARRIQALAQRLGYRPNPLISTLMENLRRGGSGCEANLAFLHAGPTRSWWRGQIFYRELHEGVHARARELGFGLQNIWIEAPRLTAAGLERQLLACGVSGVIIGPVLRPDWVFNLDRFAVVALGLSLKNPPVHRVSSDHHGAIRLGLARLRAAGHQRVGVVIRHSTDARFDHLWLGTAWADCKLQPPGAGVPPLTLDDTDDAPVLEEWLHANTPEAVLVCNHHTARSIQALRPRHAPVIAHLIREATDASFAGVVRDRIRIGAEAVNLVAAQLARNERGPAAFPNRLLVEPVWREASA